MQLPQGTAGQWREIYNQDANGGHALNVYPPVNGSINNATANAAYSQNGWTPPTQKGPAHVWVVLHDDRGGVGWAGYSVQVQ